MALKSFIDVPRDSDFPLENLPFGVFKPRESAARVGVALGEYVVDLSILEGAGQFPDLPSQGLFSQDSLNEFLALGRPAWRKVREILQKLLSGELATLRDDKKLRERVFHRQTDVVMQLPARIGNYTDFYSSYHHAHNVGTMLRGPENALMPNWKWLPVAYHGRASSVVASGAEVRRPQGQIKPPDAAAPIFGPTKSLDYELEMAFLIGPGNPLGEPVPIDQAPDHIFGFVLMNDWSARDIQAWEYQPLGPFLAKNFCTSISPWVVTLEALEPFRKPLPRQDPEPLSYLRATNDFTFDIQLEAKLQTAKMKSPHRITQTNFQNLYWSASQQLAHHTVGGCNLQPGDLLASGTISGENEDSRGCMLELTWRGANPLTLPNGETRKWLEDGDTLAISGWCEGEGYRLGFGEVSGKILPAV
ncbi:MAG TPA: fumarylacetoacetase [Chthoniobacterales bacterium]|jgi:fumarylacetoacetase|nr:fumarylacetoacetase [Chthoniobacterales bacterium]